ncbi:Neutral/alkaline nonlysosomal ceramidase [Violaceomyces palustris]|uniref:Neutral/alkaline nonlysosomal ceramidase n=1 Tax=Violaceomyces palustris TaxID=1673888 RepID=A0ACD0NT05_9BASI|nr:Neutral/alkaline nonlysosomal ceramidase [Violaceomyces palustris]
MSAIRYQPLPTQDEHVELSQPDVDAEKLLLLGQSTADDGGSVDREPSLPARAPPHSRTRLVLRVLAASCLVLGSLVAVCCLTGRASFPPWSLVGFRPSAASAGVPGPTSLAEADPVTSFGLGIADITGPIVEVNMMGYASLPQTNTGLHIRLRSRAFTVGSKTLQLSTPPSAVIPSTVSTADGSPSRWMFINADIAMGDTALRSAIVERLRDLYPGIYGERNVAFVGTHSHSGPGGWINALLPTLTSKGVIKQSFEAIVEGSVRAAMRSHDDFERRVQEGSQARLCFGTTELKEAHIQRSAYAYEQNPKWEREMYGSDMEDEFALLRFEDESGGGAGGDGPKDELTARGFLSWYAVHGTSLYENNTLTSGDNKGLAALLYETRQEPASLPGQNRFVAGFSQSTVGDTSPNVLGAFCDDGSECEPKHSTCPNSKGQERVQTCHGRGPGFGNEEALAVSPTGSYDWLSNEMIARMQVEAAAKIMERPSCGIKAGEGSSQGEGRSGEDSTTTELIGNEVNSVKMNFDMSRYTVYRKDGTRVTTCPAALGYGFAGGTTDGPGAFDFVQGSNTTDHHNPFWDVVKVFVKKPSEANKECQAPKSILLDIGEIHRPYDWGPSIVECQILRVGKLFILIFPGELTTMAGRRLKKAVRDSILANGLLPDGVEPIVQVSGPASTYAHYVTTEEEYSVQRYEGASTLFGPHTLEAYMDAFARRLVPGLKPGARSLPSGPMAKINIDRAYHLKTGVVYDNPPLGHKFGDVLEQPLLSYPVPSSSFSSSNVTVTFVGANPRNDLRLESTYLEVQRYEGEDEWKTVRTDGHHSTTMRWTRTNEATGSSKVEIAWNIEEWTEPGLYRIVYLGNHKLPFLGRIREFTATSAEFYVV